MPKEAVIEKLIISDTELKKVESDAHHADWAGARPFGTEFEGSTRLSMRLNKDERKLTFSSAYWNDDKRTDAHATLSLTGKLLKLETTTEVFSNVAEWLKARTEAEGGITKIDFDVKKFKEDIKKSLNHPEVKAEIQSIDEAVDKEKRKVEFKRQGEDLARIHKRFEKPLH